MLGLLELELLEIHIGEQSTTMASVLEDSEDPNENLFGSDDEGVETKKSDTAIEADENLFGSDSEGEQGKPGLFNFVHHI